MENPLKQAEFFGLIWRPWRRPFRLRVNDVIRIDGKLGRVIRVTESAAVVIVNRPMREFTTLFDRHVRFQPKPRTLRISANAEVEILNRTRRKKRKPSRRSAIEQAEGRSHRRPTKASVKATP